MLAEVAVYADEVCAPAVDLDEVPEGYRGERPIQKLANYVRDDPHLGFDWSPLEHLVLHLTDRPSYFCADSKNDPRYSALSEDVRDVRAFLDRPEMQLRTESTYLRLRAAACFEELLAFYIDSAERHVWLWLTRLGRIPAEGLRAFTFARFDQHFLHFRQRVESDLHGMVALLDELRHPPEHLLEKLKEVESFYAHEDEILHRALQVHQQAITQAFPGEDTVAACERLANQHKEGPQEPPVPDLAPAPQRAARLAIKRVTKLYDRLGLSAELRAFVAGKVVEISHPASPFVFRARRYTDPDRNVMAHTVDIWQTVPFKLALSTKDGEHVARLCLFADDTPILDFLLGVILHVRSGDELTIMDRANWFGFAEPPVVRERLLRDYPQFMSKVPPYMRPHSEIAKDPEFEEWMLHEPRPLRMADYAHITATGPLYAGPHDWPAPLKAAASAPTGPNGQPCDEFFYDPVRWNPYQREVQQAVGAWFGTIIVTWREYREPLDELLAQTGIDRSDPSRADVPMPVTEEATPGS